VYGAHVVLQAEHLLAPFVARRIVIGNGRDYLSVFNCEGVAINAAGTCGGFGHASGRMGAGGGGVVDVHAVSAKATSASVVGLYIADNLAGNYSGARSLGGGSGGGGCFNSSRQICAYSFQITRRA